MTSQSIKELITKFLDSTTTEKIKKTVEVEEIWKKIVGSQINKNTEIKEIKNNKIYIKTTNPIWRCELTLQKRNLIDMLNKQLKNKKIIDIIFI